MLKLSPLCLIFYRPSLGIRDGEPIYGLTKGPIVWIMEAVKDDAGILAHELEHVRQFWRHGMIVHILLLLIPSYRAWCEAEAMKKQNSV
jgi:hypothetical protein